MHLLVNRIVCSVLGRVIVVGVNAKLLSNLYLSDNFEEVDFLSRQLRQYFAVEELNCQYCDHV